MCDKCQENALRGKGIKAYKLRFCYEKPKGEVQNERD